MFEERYEFDRISRKEMSCFRNIQELSFRRRCYLNVRGQSRAEVCKFRKGRISAAKCVFNCKNRLRYSQQRALQCFGYYISTINDLFIAITPDLQPRGNFQDGRKIDCTFTKSHTTRSSLYKLIHALRWKSRSTVRAYCSSASFLPFDPEACRFHSVFVFRIFPDSYLYLDMRFNSRSCTISRACKFS